MSTYKNKPNTNTFSSNNGLHLKPALTRGPGDGQSQPRPTKRLNLKHSFAAVPVDRGGTEVKRQMFRPAVYKPTRTENGKLIEKNRSSSVSGRVRQLGNPATTSSACKPVAVRPINRPRSSNNMPGKILEFTADQNKEVAVNKNGTTSKLKTALPMNKTAAASMKLKQPSTEGRARTMTTLRMKTPSKQNAISEKISHKFTKVSHNKQTQSDTKKSAIKALQVCRQKSEDVQFKGILKKENRSDHQHDDQEIVPNTTSKHVKFKKSEGVQQASLRAKLNDWLQAKGKTPGHCRHLMCFDAQMSAEKKKPKPVYGRLSGDVLDMQENTLKKEEISSRKRLFDGCKTNTPSKVKVVTPKESSAKRHRKSESMTHVLTPSDVVNQISTKSSVKSPGPVSEVDNFNDNHCVTAPFTSSDDYENAWRSPHQPSAGTYSPLQSLTPSDKKILDNLNSMLQECLAIFKDGCSLQNILPWLHEIETNIPQARTFAPYYICKAEVFRGNPSQVLDVLCQAVERNAQPADILAKAMRDLLTPYCASFQVSPFSPLPSKMIHTMSPKATDYSDQVEIPISVTGQYHTGTPGMQLQNHVVGDRDFGSTVKYCVTPGCLIPGQTPESVPLAKVTPIRRSLRLSNRQQTPYRKELESMSDLTLREAEATVYQPNPALLD